MTRRTRMVAGVLVACGGGFGVVYSAPYAPEMATPYGVLGLVVVWFLAIWGFVVLGAWIGGMPHD